MLRFDSDVVLNQVLDAVFVAVLLVRVNGENLDFFVVEHPRRAKVHEGFEASHACPANGDDKIFGVVRSHVD